MYLGDNSDWFMGNWKDSVTFQDNSSWHYKLSTYLGLKPPGTGQYSEVTPNALQCPLEPQPYKDDSVRTYCSYKFTKRREQSLSNNPGIIVENSYGGKHAATISNPTETVAATEELQDSYLNVVGSSTAKSSDYNLFEGSVDYEPYLFPHKQNMMQVFWVDGHVKIVSRNYIFDTAENTSKGNPKGTMWDSDR
jgi:prepilin-type processing-associated H-X9-DG protein